MAFLKRVILSLFRLFCTTAVFEDDVKGGNSVVRWKVATLLRFSPRNDWPKVICLHGECNQPINCCLKGDWLRSCFCPGFYWLVVPSHMLFRERALLNHFNSLKSFLYVKIKKKYKKNTCMMHHFVTETSLKANDSIIRVFPTVYRLLTVWNSISLQFEERLIFLICCWVCSIHIWLCS